MARTRKGVAENPARKASIGKSAPLAQTEGDAGAVTPVDGTPAAAAPAASRPSDFQFFIDAISDKQIEGWIIRTGQPSHRCVVALREGDRSLARAIASRFRADLASASIGDGRHAFVIPMPPALLDGEEHVLEIIEQESGIRLTPAPVRWRAERAASDEVIERTAADEPDASGPEPLAGSRPVAAEATDFRFFIDTVTDKQIEGWVVRTEQPLHRCVVALREGDQILGRAIASRFRADLASAGVGDGQHAFVLPIAPGLLDGEEHLLEIVEEESRVRLTREPIRWRAGRPATHWAIDGRGAGLGRQASLEARSGLTGARSDTTARRPVVPQAEPGTGAASETPAPAAAGARILRETKDFRSLVAFYTREITSQLTQAPASEPSRSGDSQDAAQDDIVAVNLQ